MIRTIIIIAAALALPAALAQAAVPDEAWPIYNIRIEQDTGDGQIGDRVVPYSQACSTFLPEVALRQNTGAMSQTSTGLTGPGKVVLRTGPGEENMRVLWEPAPDAIETPGDLRRSPDGKMLAFTVYTGTEWYHPCGSKNRVVSGKGAGARIVILNVETGTLTEWPHPGLGVHDVTPEFVVRTDGIKVMFASDRAGEWPARLPRVSAAQFPALQTYVAEIDGTGAHRVGPHDMCGTWGFMRLSDYRIVSSAWQCAGLRPYTGAGRVYSATPGTIPNQTDIWATNAYGGEQENIAGSHWEGQKALHFTGEISRGRLAFVDYYRGNGNNGAGEIVAQGLLPFTIEGIPADETNLAVATDASVRRGDPGPLTPRDIISLTPWASSDDATAWQDDQGRWTGKARDPQPTRAGGMMLSLCDGPCNLTGLSEVAIDVHACQIERGRRCYNRSGVVSDENTTPPPALPVDQHWTIGWIPAGKLPSTSRDDVVVMVDEPGFINYGAIPAATDEQLFGALPPPPPAPATGDDTCRLDIASQDSDTTNRITLDGEWRWGSNDWRRVFGAEAIGTQPSDIRYVRVIQVLPNTEKQRKFAGDGDRAGDFFSSIGYSTALLGDAPVTADGSVRINVPCDTPFLIQGVDADGLAVKWDHTPQSIPKGGVLACGGCHKHNDRDPVSLVEHRDAADMTPVDLAGDAVVAPEYAADIVPIMNRRCVSCHNATAAEAGLRLDQGRTTMDMLLRDVDQALAPTPIGVYGQGTRVGRPMLTQFVGQVAIESPLYWYFAGKRTDRLNTPQKRSAPTYRAGHPATGVTDDERRTVALWIDMGAKYNPAQPIPDPTPDQMIPVTPPIEPPTQPEPDPEPDPLPDPQPGTVESPIFTLPTDPPQQCTMTCAPATDEQPEQPPAVEPDPDPKPTPEPDGPPHAGDLSAFDGATDHRQPAGSIVFEAEPTYTGGNWAEFFGKHDVAGQDGYWTNRPIGWPIDIAYSRTDPLPDSMRLLLRTHPSATGKATTYRGVIFAPHGVKDGAVEIRPQDLEMTDGNWREWHGMSTDGVRYPGRRMAAVIEALDDKYPGRIDWARGIIVHGGSMGAGGGMFQLLTLPDPWRQHIAYVSISIGGPMVRLSGENPGKAWPADSGDGAAAWDALDITKHVADDAILRNGYIRHRWSSNDTFGPAQVELTNLCERERIACSAQWVVGGHGSGELGIKKLMTGFLDTDVDSAGRVIGMDVTKDRPHPAITDSTGNYPLTAAERSDIASNPRGHHNAGIVWLHSGITETPDSVEFPLRYLAWTGIGGGIPDQPQQITISVTPRRALKFRPVDGETLRWEWDGGATSGEIQVVGDTATVTGIPLTSGDDFKLLRIYR